MEYIMYIILDIPKILITSFIGLIISFKFLQGPGDLFNVKLRWPTDYNVVFKDLMIRLVFTISMKVVLKYFHSTITPVVKVD
tara:strand:+ start:1837 stop:2082 length:246 start_codon:yes stop_codon:yes gene_type:complete